MAAVAITVASVAALTVRVIARTMTRDAKRAGLFWFEEPLGRC
jgi:hypothetical protein